MKKAEAEQRQRESNARELTARLNDFFSKRKDKDYTVRVLYRNKVDWETYRMRSIYPMQIIDPPGEVGVLFVGFKRNENIPDILWDESFRHFVPEKF
ncbi:hypothetical protein KA183_13120 [bacterium]|nr:hypothetical protein [bacterium]QQR57770.1 MAG: hypothetical protein IPG59_22830 [Candidatus Melainabacteria bacterium]